MNEKQKLIKQLFDQGVINFDQAIMLLEEKGNDIQYIPCPQPAQPFSTPVYPLTPLVPQTPFWFMHPVIIQDYTSINEKPWKGSPSFIKASSENKTEILP